MSLSNRTIQRLSDALAPEVVDYILNDERWLDFMIEMCNDAVSEKMGMIDTDLLVEISLCIQENITLKASQTK
jgi:hypothetical protein